MSLTFLRGGKFLSLSDVVDLLDNQEDKGLSLAGVFSDLWRNGLIVQSDSFRYSIETAGGHIYQRLEVWANKYRRGHKHYSDGWFLVIVLKSSTEKILSKNIRDVKREVEENPPVVNTNLVGVQGTPPVPSGFEERSDEQRGPPDPCPQCDLTWRCLHGCKRGSFT